ncbi:MAG: NADH-quinone oxidoreductase subunit M [Dehalococcoidia bacterium]|nr:NADH-quinone oxidoreductase subunit M [Dehalococcoidia bacterium]
MESIPFLSLILFFPVLGAVFIAFLPKDNARAIKICAAVFTFVSVALAILLFIIFDRSAAGAQFVERMSWIPQIDVEYYLGVDGLNLPLVLLTALLGFLAVFISWHVKVRPKEYFICLLLLETSILGVFASLDLFLFFLFWEVELFPMYLLISIWGTPPPLGRKEYSATKYVLYTIFGSALMLAGILTLYFSSGTFDMLAMGQGAIVARLIPLPAIFFLLFTAYAIKLPMFPQHTRLPDAQTDAPTAVSVMLAGVLIKMGGYGIIRICVSIFPEVARQYAPLLIALGVISVIYGAAVTLRQTDLKRLIAYSSVSHMGYVLLGVFALSTASLTGASLQMFSHGIVTGLLFAMVGLVYEKTHVRHLERLGGLARQMPIVAVVFSIAGLAALGLPGTIGFAAEFLTFIGAFTSDAVVGIRLWTILGVTGIVVTAGYTLWMLQRTFYTEPREQFNGVGDATWLERFPIFVLVGVIMLTGIYPALLTEVFQMGIGPIVRHLGF